ncbi:hypothetical protein [Mycobacterium sp. 29Ha]|uniref:hypothetical protein n=1 Tax=Mycobacterium sp. 29Ha TaxID=2939268 RepID=UPI002939426D|nr:hypothetical protein [Mycobacterium sp. 29Ha]MDV3133326.1 hypothetical protein [Mycobacterium sp. 29Ha]
MRLILAAITAAVFLWLAVIVTLVGIVMDHIVAVSVIAVVMAAALLTLRMRRRRARAAPARLPHRAHVVVRSR